MLNYMLGHAGGETLDGLRSLAVNVIGQAGYNQTMPWAPNLRSSGTEIKDERSAYFTTVRLVANHFSEAALAPRRLLKMSFMPPTLQQLAHHLHKTPEYTSAVLEQEREEARAGSGIRNNFLSLLLRLSDQEKHNRTGFSLTDEEISGNLFIFTMAGFETTANTLGFSVTLLAAHPEIQDWIREELQTLDADPSTWSYEEVFPKCRRTLALMVSAANHISPTPPSGNRDAETP